MNSAPCWARLLINGAEDDPMISEKEWFSSITITTWSGGVMPRMFLDVTVTGIVAVCVTPPPLAVTVTFVVPVAAVVLAENVTVELPLPGAAIEAGLKVAVTPDGNPDADNDTAELNPPFTAIDTVLLPELPCATETLAGEALMVKSGAVVAFTVNGTVNV